MKKTIALILTSVLLLATLSFTACSSGNSDDAFLSALAQGLEARWAMTNKFDNDEDSKETKAGWESWFNAEYDKIQSYKDSEFENADLGKWAKKYIESIEESIDCLQYYGTNQWNEKYSNGAYQRRVAALYKINSIVPIEVSGDYESNLSDLLTDGEVSEFASKVLKNTEFKKIEDEYGWKTYQAVIENTSSANFSYFSLTVGLVDKDGVTVETEEPMVEQWNAGEKTRFEFSTDEKFEKLDVKYASWDF